MYTRFLALIAITVLLGADRARAEYGRTTDTQIDPSVVMIDEDSYLGAKVDPGYRFLAFDGREFTMGDMLGRPLVLILSYFDCDGACPTINSGLRKTLKGVEGYALGADYSVLTVSFDAEDTKDDIGMFEKKAGIGAAERGDWRVAVMKDPADIERLTGSVGFKFFWSKRDKLFVHSSVYIFLSPEGRVTRYLYSAMAGPRDVEVAIAEAGFGNPGKSKVKDLTDLLLVACYSYNFKEGRYTLNYPLFIATGSLAGGLALIGLSIVISKKKARR
ncbi:MAG: SCO family protein [Thermodesulfobacteriota bacterium]